MARIPGRCAATCGPYTSGDCGELETAAQHGVYVFGLPTVTDNSLTDPQSVASMVSVGSLSGYSDFFSGYMLSDEPNSCPAYAAVITNADTLASYDPTRPVYDNFTAFPLFFPGGSCSFPSGGSTFTFANTVQSLGISSFDLYPLTSTAAGVDFLVNHYHVGDKNLTPVDTLWAFGFGVKQLVSFSGPNQPVWAYIETGGDSNASTNDNTFQATVSNGTVTVQDCPSSCGGYSTIFTQNWKGLSFTFTDSSSQTITATVKAITSPTSTQAAQIILDNKSSTGTVSVTVAVTGGVGTGPNGNDCIASKNICVVNGHEWHATPEQVNAEAWIAVINGAVGLEEFCQDASYPSVPSSNGTTHYGSNSMCLGDPDYASLSSVIASNLAYVNGNFETFAPWLTDVTVAKCSMDSSVNPPEASNSCTNGILSVSTANVAVPGAALLKQHAGAYYLVAQSSRNSPTNDGVTLTFGLGTQEAGKTATVIYDSDQQYNTQYSTLGKTIKLGSSGTFADSFGAHHDDYQVKVFRIQ